jgi:hypothetical protein
MNGAVLYAGICDGGTCFAGSALIMLSYLFTYSDKFTWTSKYQDEPRS